MGGTISIGRIFGIQISLHWSWVFIFALLTWSFASNDGILDSYTDWSDNKRIAAAVIISGIFFASILAHELSHSLVARAKGIPVTGITLFVFGGVSNLGREAESAGEEFQVAIVGPLTSIVVGGLFAIAWVALWPVAENEAKVAAYLAFINVVIGIFNLLPGYPLDGGRVLRAFVWWRNHDMLRATRFASRTGVVVAYLMMAGGAVQFFFNPIGGIWLFMIGLFLRNSSSGSYEQLVLQQTVGSLRAGDLSTNSFHAIDPQMTVAQLVDDYMLTGRGRAYPVVAGEELLGLITLTDVKHIPREQWASTSVFRAMTPRERLHTITPQEPVLNVLQMMAEVDINQVPVMDGIRITGMVSRSDIVRFIRDRSALLTNT
jgi:Zn-dependent protease